MSGQDGRLDGKYRVPAIKGDYPVPETVADVLDTFAVLYQGGDPRWILDYTRDEIAALAKAAEKRLKYQEKASKAENTRGSHSKGRVTNRSLDHIPAGGIRG